ncbi:MAG: transposase [Candidatus Zixiibacteriota bacterium]
MCPYGSIRIPDLVPHFAGSGRGPDRHREAKKEECSILYAKFNKLLFLPPYSPELNPVEKLWQWIRFEATHNLVFDPPFGGIDRCHPKSIY